MSLYYIAHRLFSAHDRALGAYVADRLASRVGEDAVFLPFCDTDEEALISDCKGRLLFDLDRERLRRIDGMIALLHGPSLDDGVCMEIGFSAALGVPVIALTTDFQIYGLTSDGPTLTFQDPLLDIIATEVVRVHRLAPLQTSINRFEAFLDRNLRAVQLATDQAIAALLSVQSQPSTSRISPSEKLPRAFIEPSPYLTHEWWRDARRLLGDHGWEVAVAKRFRNSADPREAAHADWAEILGSDLALVDLSGPETPPGAAIITGACSATGRAVLAPELGGLWTFAEGREPNSRNLMIQYAINGRFAAVGELATQLGLC
jgi:hypothetical protein